MRPAHIQCTKTLFLLESKLHVWLLHLRAHDKQHSGKAQLCYTIVFEVLQMISADVQSKPAGAVHSKQL